MGLGEFCPCNPFRCTLTNVVVWNMVRYTTVAQNHRIHKWSTIVSKWHHPQSSVIFAMINLLILLWFLVISLVCSLVLYAKVLSSVWSCVWSYRWIIVPYQCTGSFSHSLHHDLQLVIVNIWKPFYQSRCHHRWWYSVIYWTIGVCHQPIRDQHHHPHTYWTSVFSWIQHYSETMVSVTPRYPFSFIIHTFILF